MRLKYALICGAMLLAQGGVAHASSSAAVQAGKISVEGSMYSDGYLGLMGEVGLTSNAALCLGSEDRIPSLRLKWQLKERDAKSDVAVNAGLLALGDPGLTVGLTWNYRLSSTSKLFADVAFNSASGYAFTNAGLGLSLNIAKQAALTAQVRSLGGWATLGLGVRCTF